MQKFPLSLISGLIILGIIIFFGLAGPLVIDTSGYEVASVMPSQEPSGELWFGSDSQGRDMLAVTIYSIPQTIKIALIAGLVGVLIGLILGLISGYIGGYLDSFIRILSDSIMTVPGLAILIIIATNVESMTVELMGLTVASLAWMHPTRTIRSQVLSIREHNYIKVSKANGLNNLEIIFTEIMPNLYPYIAACLVASITGAILATVGLESLGLGTQDDHTLGTTIYWARRYSAILRGQWWWWGPPILIISLIFIGLFLVSIGLDAYSNPKLLISKRKKTTKIGTDKNKQLNDDTSILEINNLTVTYETENNRIDALKNINLKLGKNEIMGVIGESGSGKSTLANTLMGVLSHPGYISEGQINYDNKIISNYTEEEMNSLRSSSLALVPQSAMNSLNPVLNIRRQMVDILVDHGISNEKHDQMIEDLLLSVDLKKDVLNLFPNQLSGGMKQRVVMAISTSLKPKLIIADEPTSALDVIVQQKVMSTLYKIKNNLNCAMLLIGHDIGLIAQFCDSLIVIYNGKIVESGKITDVINNPQDSYTKHLINSLPKFGAS